MGALVWFARGNLRRPWHEDVSMYDSSLGGYGVMAGTFPQRLVEQVGSYDERWRFKKEYQGGRGPRAAALLAADPLGDVETVLPIVRDPGIKWKTPPLPRHPLRDARQVSLA